MAHQNLTIIDFAISTNSIGSYGGKSLRVLVPAWLVISAFEARMFRAIVC